jgi:hypothetical protein
MASEPNTSTMIKLKLIWSRFFQMCCFEIAETHAYIHGLGLSPLITFYNFIFSKDTVCQTFMCPAEVMRTATVITNVNTT